MKTVVVLPMGAHPFHPGHYALYQSAVNSFPNADVYIAATSDTSQRPFPFQIKQKLAKLSGVPENRFVQVKSPFQAREITANLDPENTQLIFVRSEKDANKPPQAGGVKKDGNPAYLQPLEGQGELAPMNRHAYMAYLPTVEFGPGMTSATEIRTAWPRLNEKRKTALVMSLYPKTQTNPKLASTVVKMLDTAIGTELDEDLNRRGLLKGIAGAGALGAAGVGIYKLDQWDKEQEKKFMDLITDPADKVKYLELKIDANKAIAIAGSNQALKTLAYAKAAKADEMRHSLAKKYNIDLNLIGDVKDKELNEFAPDEGGGSRKFIPWPEFIEQVKQIVAKDFDCVENVVKTTIKARFVPHDPMEYGPTMLYSYYETRAGRNKGAISTRGAIQVGKYTGGGFTGQIKGKLLTTFSLLKGHPFERHFDLTFDNIYKIANIILGNTEGALEFKPEQVAEGSKIAKHNKLAKAPKPKNQQEYDDIEKYKADLVKSYQPKKTQGVAETALQGKEDLDAKRKALQDLEREPGADQAAIRQRKLDLEKEARAKGLAEDYVDEKK